MVTGELCARVVMCVCVQLWVAMVRVVCEAKSSLQCVCGRVRVCLGSCLSDHWFVSCASEDESDDECVYVCKWLWMSRVQDRENSIVCMWSRLCAR